MNSRDATRPAYTPTPAERDHVVALIGQTQRKATTARYVAEKLGLTETAERISWALDFLADAGDEAAGRR